MPDSLAELETERSKILREFTSLGDLRPGSICATPRRCGKSTCHCAKPDDPGHDPQIRLMRKLDGKMVAESFSSLASFRKAQAEVNEYHRFQSLTAELLAVNERVCRLRPVKKEPVGWSAEKTKRLLRSIRSSRERKCFGPTRALAATEVSSPATER